LGPEAFAEIGVSEQGEDARDRVRLNDLAANPPLPETHVRNGGDGALFHPAAGLAYPDRVLSTLSQSARLHPKAVVELGHASHGWQVRDEAGDVMAEADILILCAGPGTEALLSKATGRHQPLGVPLEGRAGQISLARAGQDVPDHAVAGGPYGAPFHGRLLFGATFDPWDLTQNPPPVSTEGHARNQVSLAKLLPDLAASLDLVNATGRTSVRTAAPDRLPIAGPVPDAPPGLWMLGGLGSRGFTSAFLCAETIASQLMGEPSPLEDAVGDAVSPDRFNQRQAKRRPGA
jgi:tRNA 5-methylaminomethyl-2-thiouridine biosynthesis bifunctional protein